MKAQLLIAEGENSEAEGWALETKRLKPSTAVCAEYYQHPSPVEQATSTVWISCLWPLTIEQPKK